MYLKKFTAIKNVGKFKAARISGGEYAKYTLAYGGNGRGKTTLCAVLRSLQQNDPKLITQRKTFAAAGAPEVGLLLDSGPVRFSAGAWSAHHGDLHIFDSRFIGENVHGGNQIDTDHRRNFYKVVVGPLGVKLAGEIDALDEAATAKQTAITAEKKVLQQHVPQGMTLEAFLKLDQDPNIEEKITVAERALKAVNDAGIIAGRKLLGTPKLPAAPDNLAPLLGKGVDGIAADAAARVQTQLQRHQFEARGEAWLAEGLSHVRGDACPFCENPLAGNALIEAYNGYFSEAYAEHRRTIEEMRKDVANALGQATGLRTAQGFKDAATDGEFWAEYCDHGYKSPTGAIERISTELASLHQAAMALVEAKIAAPLEPIALSPEYTNAKAAWDATYAELNIAVASAEPANKIIQGVKDKNANADKAKVAADLAKATAKKKRHEDPFLTLAKGYDTLNAEKQKLVRDKDAKKAELDTYDAKILGDYENDINTILGAFDAGFRLAQCGKNYVGKVPQSSYCLRFNTTDVDISKRGSDDPTFDTTMSAGDKNTFALAFFLAQLQRDPEINKKIIVFDDPFTSLDDFRREMTAKAIKRIGEKAAQVIVLSHDKYFLDAVRTKLHGAPCTAIQISATAGASSIETWDIEKEVKEGYLQDHMRLLEFAQGLAGDARDMRTIMRPLLEQYIRYRFPNQILDGKWLGDMLGIIRADQNHPMQPHYAELDDINEYTAPFHHDPNATFNPDEVLAYSKRTIAILGGC